MHQPLPQVFPEYCIVKHPQGAREFKVETKRYFQWRNAPGPYFAGLCGYALAWIFPVLGAVAWQMVCVLVRTWPFPLKAFSVSSLGPGAELPAMPNPVRLLESNTSALG